MAYGIYGVQDAQAAQKKQPQASDVFSTTAAPNSAQAVAQEAQPNQAGAATGAAAPNPFATPGATTPFGPSATPGGFEQLLNNAQPARAANVTAAQQSISDMLMAPTGPSRESAAARSAFIKAQNEAGRDNREASAGAGRLATGQIGDDVSRFNDRALGQRADLENQLAVSDANRADANRQAGVSALLGMEGLGEQSRGTTAQIAQADKALAENARQFNSREEFETWATKEGWNQDAIQRAWQSSESERGRTSTEKIAFAGLALEERSLAQEGMQFDKKQEFDKWALTKQLDDNTANRIWQAIENEKSRTFEGGENALDRALNSSQFAEKLGLEKSQLAETVRQFNSREEFDRWAKGVDVDQAEKDRVWKAQQDDVSRKWQTGERLSTQEHEVFLEKLQEDGEIRVMERNQVLNLETLEQQQAHEEKILGLKNTYDTQRMQEGFSHEEAMANLEGEIAKMLSSQGYTQEQALQGAHIEAQRIEGERTREMEERISMAQLASSSSIAQQELGIKKEQLDLARQELESEIGNNAALLGMRKEEFELAKEDSRFARALDTAAILTEKWGDNPDTQAKAADILFNGLREIGMITEDQYRLGVLNSKISTFKDPAAPAAKTWAAENGYSTEEFEAAVGTAKEAFKENLKSTVW